MLCGMMTAPSMPTACSSARSGMVGMARPCTRRGSREPGWAGGRNASARACPRMLTLTISPPSGPIMPKTMKKVVAMVKMSAAKKASSLRTPRRSSSRKVKVSVPVMSTPSQSGRPKSSFSAMAEPTTSWMSLPMMAISVMIHSTSDTGRGYSSRHSVARSRPLTTPSRAAITCSTRPNSVDQNSTQISE